MLTAAKVVAALALCLCGVAVLGFAWIMFIFTGDATPGYETVNMVRAAFLAILGLGLGGAGIFIFYRIATD